MYYIVVEVSSSVVFIIKAEFLQKVAPCAEGQSGAKNCGESHVIGFPVGSLNNFNLFSIFEFFDDKISLGLNFDQCYKSIGITAFFAYFEDESKVELA
jgi:hypothetical protein